MDRVLVALSIPPEFVSLSIFSISSDPSIHIPSIGVGMTLQIVLFSLTCSLKDN